MAPKRHPVEQTAAFQALLSTPILTLPDDMSVRPWHPSDAPVLATLLTDRRIWWCFDEHPYPWTLRQAQKTIKEARRYSSTASKTVMKEKYSDSDDDSDESDSDDDEGEAVAKRARREARETAALDKAVDVADLTLTDFAIVQRGELIGGIEFEVGAKVSKHQCWLAYWMAREHRGRGIMTAVVAAFVDWLWTTFDPARLLRIEAGVFVSWNKQSGRVLEKCGFRKELIETASIYKGGRLGNYQSWFLLRDGTEEKLWKEGDPDDLTEMEQLEEGLKGVDIGADEEAADG